MPVETTREKVKNGLVSVVVLAMLWGIVTCLWHSHPEIHAAVIENMFTRVNFLKLLFFPFSYLF